MARAKIAARAAPKRRKKGKKPGRIGRPPGSKSKKRSPAELNPLELAQYFCEVAATLHKGGMPKEDAVNWAAQMLNYQPLIDHGGH